MMELGEVKRQRAFGPAAESGSKRLRRQHILSPCAGKNLRAE
jgi:hypothetical protein